MNILLRIYRRLTFRKGIYGAIGKKNHFSGGVIVYENAQIGNYNYFSPYAMINNAAIGNYCSIGPGARIGLGEHDTNCVSMRPIIANGEGEMKLFDPDKRTAVGHDVWIGTNAVLLQGVKVGNGAVIGANAVITRDVPAYAVAVGVPGEIIRFRFDDKICNEIEKSKWFEEEEDKARKIVADLRRRLSL